jgi:hypothetical protein
VFPDHWSFMPRQVAHYSAAAVRPRGLRVFFTGARSHELTDLPKDVCDE